MKYSILTFFAIPMIAFMGTANANIGSTPTSKELQATLRSCTPDTPECRKLFAAKGACDVNSSGDLGDLNRCYGAALAAYHGASGVVAVAAEPYEGELLPVSTNTADALYEYPADDKQKGFLQAREN
jgi:hypothetical protein